MASSVNLDLRNSFEVHDQRVILKFLYAQGNTAAEAHLQLVKTLGSNALGKSKVCPSDSKASRMETTTIQLIKVVIHIPDLKLEQRIKAIQEAFQQSSVWSLRSLSAFTGIPKSSFHEIITEKLGMRKAHAKWVPHQLSDD